MKTDVIKAGVYIPRIADTTICGNTALTKKRKNRNVSIFLLGTSLLRETAHKITNQAITVIRIIDQIMGTAPGSTIGSFILGGKTKCAVPMASSIL
jgi:hypothetical protein